jgi:hypothetical protein
MVEGYREHYKRLIQAEEEHLCCDVYDAKYYDIERALARGTALSEVHIIRQKASDIYTFESSSVFASRLKPSVELLISKTDPNVDGEYQKGFFTIAKVIRITQIQYTDTYEITMQWDGPYRHALEDLTRVDMYFNVDSFKIWRRCIDEMCNLSFDNWKQQLIALTQSEEDNTRLCLREDEDTSCLCFDRSNINMETKHVKEVTIFST